MNGQSPELEFTRVTLRLNPVTLTEKQMLGFYIPLMAATIRRRLSQNALRNDDQAIARVVLMLRDITRNTHYVPQATLRRWSENGSHVYAYDILVPHASVPDWQRRGIKRVARQVDLY